MKKFFLIAFLAVLSSIFTNVNAQEKNYVLSTGNPNYVPAIIGTANTLAENKKENLGKIKIVLYGKAVQDLNKSSTTKLWLDKVTHKAIEFSACAIALKKFDVQKQHIPKEFEVVEDAFVYLLELKEKGYYALDL